MQLSSNDCEPVFHLFIDIVSLLFERLECPWFQILTFTAARGPVLVWRLHPIVGGRDLEDGGPLTHDPLC